MRKILLSDCKRITRYVSENELTKRQKYRLNFILCKNPIRGLITVTKVILNWSNREVLIVKGRFNGTRRLLIK